MNKLLLLLIAGAVVSAADGYEVYKKHCMSCHVEMISVKETKRTFKTLKAPPMVEVSNKIKENIIVKDDDEDIHRHLVTLFIKDYIENPALDYSMCHAMALERFGVMPSLKGKLNSDEINAVAEWIYDRYEDVKFQ
ncbi:MAG: c-type cytochrome [Campylobacterota bacterium]|nr:c-type cytochrome [Campylobacterota bacterium]